MIAVGERGGARAILGFIPPDGDRIGREIPWRAVSVASRCPGTGGAYVALRGGQISFGGFLDDGDRYRVPPHMRILMPRHGTSDFGVWDEDAGAEDPAMTREIFGCTGEDLLAIVRTIAGAQRPAADGFPVAPEFPRVTSSRLSNDCDISGAYIPPRFPYLSFHGDCFRRSHVSLPGFYAYLAMSAEIGRLGACYRAEGFPMAALQHILGMPRGDSGPRGAPRFADWPDPDFPGERAGGGCSRPPRVRGRAR